MTEHDKMKRAYWGMCAADVHLRALEKTKAFFQRVKWSGTPEGRALFVLMITDWPAYKPLWIERYHVEKRRILDAQRRNPLH